MKVLLDNGLPRGAVPILNAHQIDANHVGDIGLSSASDQSIMNKAISDGRIIVTLDADFHTLLALSGAIGPSVIRIRIEGLKAMELARIINTVIKAFPDELRAGAVVSVGPKSARCRLLPL
jgi:predicted nuclease of predicted toxin-antitoxin system